MSARYTHSIALTKEREDKLAKIRATGRTLASMVNDVIDTEYICIIIKAKKQKIDKILKGAKR